MNRFEAPHGAYHRCLSCRAILRDLSAAAYEALNPTYDPGPCLADARDPDVRAYLCVDDRKEVLRPLVARGGPGSRLLDIGCGAGGYMLAARELGCPAVGLEPSLEHSTVGRSLGLDIRSGYFTAGIFPAGSFDIVLLSHVIEHIYDPKRFLREVFEVVKPGGVLVVVTPNADSLVARICGPYWTMLKPVDHVSLLSERSFRAMGLDAVGGVAFRQRECAWEPFASVASAGLSFLRARSPRRCTPSDLGRGSGGTENHQPRPRLRFDTKRRAVLARAACTVASLPLHVLATATNTRACLVMELSKPAPSAMREQPSSH